MHWTNAEHAADLRHAVNAERERCAKIAEAFAYRIGMDLDRREKILRKSIAEAIRNHPTT